MATYFTEFYLTNSLANWDNYYDAKDYLAEDNMRKYLNEYNISDEGELEKIKEINWVLEDFEGGKIYVKTSDNISAKTQTELSDWISGQNSDGLGEGFEQQPFAEIYDETFSEDEDDYWDSLEYCSFDWRTNKYILEYLDDTKY